MDEERKSGQAVYRWTCPICGMRRVSLYASDASFRAANDLRTHIRSTEDDEHGGENELPERVEPEALDRYVAHVDDLGDEIDDLGGSRDPARIGSTAGDERETGS